MNKALDGLVHNGLDGGVHIGEVMVEKGARAACLLGHGGHRQVGHSALGADEANRLEDPATALVPGEALGGNDHGGASIRLGFDLLRGGVAR